MELRTVMTQLATTIRKFVVPRYHPELHYMRGPGPACACRACAPRRQTKRRAL
jgi:hypothetical protein